MHNTTNYVCVCSPPCECLHICVRVCASVYFLFFSLKLWGSFGYTHTHIHAVLYHLLWSSETIWQPSMCACHIEILISIDHQRSNTKKHMCAMAKEQQKYTNTNTNKNTNGIFEACIFYTYIIVGGVSWATSIGPIFYCIPTVWLHFLPCIFIYGK